MKTTILRLCALLLSFSATVQAAIHRVCHGGDDQHVNKEVPAFREEMIKSKASMEFVTYEGALHGFTKPGPAYQEKADKESWEAMKKLFAGSFKK